MDPSNDTYISSKLNALTRILDKVGVFSRWTNIIGVLVLFLMVFATFANVIMRYIFNSPIGGVPEITEVMMIIAVFLAIAHTHNEDAHIKVDLITSKMAEKPRLVLEFITTLLAFGTFIVVFWRVIEQTRYFIENGLLHSKYLEIPSGPFSMIIALGCLALTILLLRDLLRKLVQALKLGLSWYHWTLMIVIPISFIVLAIFWMNPDLWKISLPLVGLIGAIFSLILFLTGMPIAFALILTSLVFLSHVSSPHNAFDIIGLEPYRSTANYTWSTLAFFVLMGFFCLHARFGEDLYYSAYRFIGHLRGGMATATIGACTGFAAIVGDPVSSCATMGSVAMPQMRKFGYDDKLTAGSITSGASLGPIIPPSTAFIVYGFITGVSIGDLFIAGILPGILAAAIFAFIIFLWCRIDPKAGPPGERSSWKSRIVSLRSVGPVAILFVIVIGGIYQGVFTPTEGGSVGAVIAFILWIVYGRFSRKGFLQALLEAGKVTSMVFLILIAATMFTKFAAWTNLSNSAHDLIINLGLPPVGFLLVVLMVFIVLGFFVDLMPLFLIGVPIAHPIAVALGMDPIWFAMLVCLSINLGALSPPVGMNLFVLKGMFPEIPISTIFKGALPFVAGTLVVIAIIILVPDIATWLPEALR